MLKHAFSTAILLVSLPAFAQGPGPMGFGRGDFAMRTPVTNVPYTATYITSSTEKLQDGTVLTHTSTRIVERDSLGRTREEINTPAHGDSDKTRTMIVIMDPVTRTVTQLRTDQKIAVVHTLPQPGAAAVDRPHHAPAMDSSAAATAPNTPHLRPNEVVADLGSKTISGVVAAGRRVTRTIATGEMGNAAPLVSTRETWFSTDLKIELGSSEVDPFRGTRTTTVSALSKAEPDATLFQVPTGYTVQQAPQRAFGHRGPAGPHNQSAALPPPGA